MDSILAIQIGRQIKAFRALRAWSQDELAEHAGLTQTQVSALERGKSQHIGNLEAVAKAFGLSVSEMIKVAENIGDFT